MAHDAAMDEFEEGYAGFGVRLLAYLIDLLLISIIFVLFNFVANWFGVHSRLITMLIILFNTFFAFGYLVIFWATSGQTPGKQVLGLKVVGPNGGFGGIGYGRALLRAVGYMINTFAFYLGFLWIIWDGEKQGWHDKLAGTHVVRLVA